MNLNQVKLNMVIPNYRKLCELLDLKIHTGGSKQIQFREMEKYFKYHKEGNKFIIDEIYSELKNYTKRENRGGSHNRKEFPNFLISKEDENKIGIYKIVINNNIYIGSTIKSFRIRFLKHNNEKHNTIPFTSNMLKEGAIFDLLEICEDMTEPQIRELENKYIKEYKENNDWNLVNSRDTWSYIISKQKYKTIKIRVKEEDYQEALISMRENKLVEEII